MECTQMVRKSKKEIERGEQLYQLTSLVAGEFSLQEVLDKLAEAAVTVVGVKACSIRLLDEEPELTKINHHIHHKAHNVRSVELDEKR